MSSSGGPGTGTPGGTAAGTGDPWTDDGAKTPGAEPGTAAEIEADIEAVRRQMSDVAGELQRRGHRVAEVSRRWGKRVAPIAGGLVVLAAAGLAYRYWWSRRRVSRPERWVRSLKSVEPRAAFDEVRTRVSRAIAPRESRSHRLWDAGLKVGTALAGAVASTAGKQLARKLIAPASERTAKG
jgi:hypothetical protein